MAQTLPDFKTSTIDAVATALELTASQKTSLKKMTDVLCAEFDAHMQSYLAEL